ncbi:MAG: hypothetical protein B5M53_11405 [Candidatus Cloacimonas sp. 4484_209]|nr:MAG: hypothetical protein B5M53_11405 [Candidatus Cloacimonas sp. 4484_209]
MKLIEITPESIRSELCGFGSCLSIFKTDQDTYIIIGKKLSLEETKLLKDKIGPDEGAIELPKRFIDEILKQRGLLDTK